MRGVETRIQEIRHAIFTEVAKMAYDVDSPVEKTIEEIPYRVIPGEVGNFRNDVFLERAIVGERLRLAMGLPCRSAAEHAPISDNIKLADQAETYYTPPLINVIKFACNACHEKRVLITEGCQGCLAHPCVEVCPKKAITLDRTNGRSYIDQDKCVKCGQCAKVCGYQAIIIQERPCARACGMDAIGSDENGKADIDYEKCVSCGQCLVNCPFGAISDKSQIFQVIRAIQSGERVYAALAPAFVGQFGPKVTPGKLRAAMKKLGFADVFEVAIGADLCAAQEAEDFVNEVPEKLPFMATSCCPAWSVMAKKLFPDYANCISMALTPLGYIRTPGLSITLLTVPVAVGAIILGPVGGLICGLTFGLTSFYQCFVGGAMGTVLLGINPFGTFVTTVVTRTLEGFLTGLIFKGLHSIKGVKKFSYYIASLCCPLLNTLLFMSSLVLFFYNTDYVQAFVTALGAKNPLIFVVLFVGVQGLIEAGICFIVASVVSRALYAALKLNQN